MATAKKAAGKSVKTAAKQVPAKGTPAKTAAKSPATKVAAKKTDVMASGSQKAPSHKEIAELAHHYWKERGHHHGSHESDWTRAEKELRGK